MGIVKRWRRIWSERKAKEAYAIATLRQARAEKERATVDVEYAERVLQRHKPVSAAKRAITWANAQVGTVEQPAGSNSGPKIDAWQKLVETKPGEMHGQPWCGAFMFATLKAAGVKDLSWRMRYVPYIVEDAKLGRNGMKQLVPWADRKPGDLVIYQFDTGAVDHVGIYLGDNADGTIRTVEGNTSSGTAGSQSNGGGVFRRARARAVIAYLARPKYA